MAIKKKVKRKFAAKKVSSTPKSNENFFQRMKEIIKSEMPQSEKVRVKTFIVEKPVIIHDKASKYDSDDSTYDSKRSRYSRNSLATGMGLVKQKKKSISEDELDQASEDEQFTDDSNPDDDLSADANDDSTDDSTDAQSADDVDLIDEGSVDAGGEELSEETSPAPLTHTRSRGMFNNIWWKKALFWAILTWLFILAISMAMFAMKLITVNFERQWWVLLAIIIVVEMIYFKFLDGKLKI